MVLREVLFRRHMRPHASRAFGVRFSLSHSQQLFRESLSRKYHTLAGGYYMSRAGRGLSVGLWPDEFIRDSKCGVAMEDKIRLIVEALL